MSHKILSLVIKFDRIADATKSLESYEKLWKKKIGEIKYSDLILEMTHFKWVIKMIHWNRISKEQADFSASY